MWRKTSEKYNVIREDSPLPLHRSENGRKTLTVLGRSFLSVKSSFVLSHNSFPGRPDTPRYKNSPLVTGRGI